MAQNGLWGGKGTDRGSHAPESARHPSFGEAFLFWLKLGFISFGGPTGQIAVMHAELVEKNGSAKRVSYTRSTTACFCVAQRHSNWLPMQPCHHTKRQKSYANAF
jgi:hypothetical protein